MLYEFWLSLFGHEVGASFVAAIADILVTVVVVGLVVNAIDSYSKRSAREYVIQSIAKRLDSAALGWAFALQHINMLSVAPQLASVFKRATDSLDKTIKRLEKINPKEKVVQQASPPTALPPEPPNLSHRPEDQALIALLEGTLGELDDLLSATDTAGVIVDPSMHDELVKFRDPLMRQIRGIRSLHSLLREPTKEKLAAQYGSACDAGLSGDEYPALLGNLWSAIPGRWFANDKAGLDFGRLRELPTIAKQRESVGTLLKFRFPEER